MRIKVCGMIQREQVDALADIGVSFAGFIFYPKSPRYVFREMTASQIRKVNNINKVGDVPRTEVLTLQHPGLVKVQEALVRKIVNELRGFDNLYFEVANEPYAGRVPREWEEHIARIIAEDHVRGRVGDAAFAQEV